jgi:Alpha/beta hydrolase family
VGTDPRLVLLASPLLGPAVWSRVSAELRARGRQVVVPAPYGAVTDPADVLRHLSRELPLGVPLVLVAHSNAGLYTAALAATHDVRGIVFVDAGLPSDDPTTPTAPAPFREFLAGLADDDGLLPQWTRWWPAEDLAGLFPDGEARASVEAEEPRLPLAYFDAAVPSPSVWRSLPAAYLAFGETYGTERALAEQRGWPVVTLPGEHLHLLTDPEGVAAALEGLLGRLGLVPPR